MEYWIYKIHFIDTEEFRIKSYRTKSCYMTVKGIFNFQITKIV